MFPSSKESIGFACDALPGATGYTWTLTTRLGHFLSEAERLFGPRDTSWTPLGIEFHGDIPHIWYPGNGAFVSIILTDDCRKNSAQALFQLAHEVVRLLSPSGGRHAPVVEEGLATIFMDLISTQLHLGMQVGISSYLRAKYLASSLLEMQSNAIIEIRKIEPAFRNWTPELIRSVIPKASEELASSLCEPFIR